MPPWRLHATGVTVILLFMSPQDRPPEGPATACVDDQLTLPPRPERPSPDDCCKAGCHPCIFELYEDQLERWEQTVARLRAQAARDLGDVPSDPSAG